MFCVWQTKTMEPVIMKRKTTSHPITLCNDLDRKNLAAEKLHLTYVEFCATLKAVI